MDNRNKPFHYNRKNLPPDPETAEDRLSFLTDEIENMKAQLTYVVPGDFVSDDAYESWKASCLRAYSSFQVEKDFLSNWIRKDRQQTKTEIFYNLRRDALEAALLLGVKQGTPYSIARPPPNIEVAVSRREKLLTLREKSRIDSQRIGDLCGNNKLTQAERTKIQKPLKNALERIHMEIRLLKQFVKVCPQTKHEQAD